MKIAKRLIELRKEKNITQKELAKNIGCTDSAVSLWELGTSEPKASYIFAIAKYFNITSDYLLGLTDY